MFTSRSGLALFGFMNQTQPQRTGSEFRLAQSDAIGVRPLTGTQQAIEGRGRSEITPV